jgi:hypothetical protein
MVTFGGTTIVTPLKSTHCQNILVMSNQDAMNDNIVGKTSKVND